ncbi:16S rRNA (uracil(1498)-N(3))-methyltransferase [Robertkochia marina]|uniref:Ribosomal RNA small subunit methyltransferase E n=1 Tax=Robertkochia marina TaxID=1227945 RepID=A0A4S3LYQ3_9FLAO|nr:16S rRNA (uracil(1498)-N(3))-methyltransferase [Robertkochia marina]THD66748.1 16S rRNA (uracil(1498)-N(3))-methyltransferase [Robertkochia marina]TRZ42362.1 16S rRNA (uracil(1498)-N(3))-methyltransferase [Robertkochia marina]
MQLFYAPSLTPDTTVFAFDKDESRHISKVLRKREGDEIHITDGKGYLYYGHLTLVTPKACEVQIERSEEKIPRRYSIHMAVAPTKSNDRYEWFLEKATEIGVDEITPIICDHSERKVVKTDRMEKILQSAMKQSLSCFLPKLNPPVSLKEFIVQEHNAHKFIAHCYEKERFDLKRRVQPDFPVLMLIGPEGDFSEEEVSLALDHGFLPVILGDNRLRTETAAIVACNTVALINQ